MHLIFVYGTLKSGEPNSYLMKDETCGVCISRGFAYSKEKFPLVVASRYNVPYLLYKPGSGHHVKGELYEVDDAQLERLDKLENHPSMYIRQDITVTTKRDDSEKGEDVKALAYFLVNYRDNLLDLPMTDNYKDLTDGKRYFKPQDRDVPAPLWWYEVHTGYDKEDETNGLCTARGSAVTLERFPLVIASRYNIPFMLYAPGKGKNIQGELYEVDEVRLKSLDNLEAHPFLYERRDIIVNTEIEGNNSNTIEAQAYFLVKYRPFLLELPMFTIYDNSIKGQMYLSPIKREAGKKDPRHWWFEVNTEYDALEEVLKEK